MKNISDKKAYLLIFILIVSALLAFFIYAKVFLVQKFQEALLTGLSESVCGRVTVDATRLSLLKGVVVENIRIYDEQAREVVFIAEVSSGIFFPLLGRKGIVMPEVTVSSPRIAVRRLRDGAVKIVALRQKKTGAHPVLFVKSIKVIDGVVTFVDESLTEPYQAQFANVRARVLLYPASAIRVHIKADKITDEPGSLDAKVTIPRSGEDIRVEIEAAPVQLREFGAYTQEKGFVLADGLLDLRAECLIKDAKIHAIIAAQIRQFALTRQFFVMHLDGKLTGQIQHDLKTAQTRYAGKVVCRDASIEGIKALGPVTDIDGVVLINNDAVSSDRITAHMWGIPVDAHFMLTGIRDPTFVVHLEAENDLSLLQEIAQKRRFFRFPGMLSGPAHLSLDLRTYPQGSGEADVSGELVVREGSIVFEDLPEPLSNLSAHLSFGKDFLQWSDLRFFYGKKRFRSDGVLNDFVSPGISASVVADDLAFDTIMTVHRGIAQVHTLKGTYARSLFDLQGQVFLFDPLHTKTFIRGKLTADCEDIKRLYGQRFSILKRADPTGVIETEFSAEGIFKKPDSFKIKAQGSSSRLDFYGLRARDINFAYDQSQGVIEVERFDCAFYGGKMHAQVTVNSAAAALPFWISTAFEEVHLEELRQDVAVNKKDLTGVLDGEVKLRGIMRRPEDIKGSGALIIKNGKLWQLNLFKKLGKVLFPPEHFASIVFSEGSSSFVIRDRALWTDDLVLRSQVSNIKGRMKVGFDHSLSGMLTVHVLDEMVPLTGTFKDITTAIVGKADRFGSIHVGGTIEEPNYEFYTAMGDIFQGVGRVFRGE